MYSITKEIHFCYGHRLMHHPGKCRNLHGHSVRAAITVAADVLDEQGMVCDFAEIKERISRYIDRELDHNLLLHQDDPLIARLSEAGERFTAFAAHPTAEFLARLIYEEAKRSNLPVIRVTLWETDSAYASYSDTYPPSA